MHRTRLFITESWRDHPSLVVLVLFSLVCLVISVSGLVFDDRMITGEHAWIKPCKFSISLATYGFTLLWYSLFLKHHERLIRRISGAALVGTIVELSTIITQVLRGTTSHFNTSTALNHVMFWITTSAIIPVAGAIIVLFVVLLRDRSLTPMLGASLRWAIFLTIVGFVPAVLMILPDRLQDAITCYKQFDGHTVGFSEGGPGIPWLGWSTVAGDLRIAHFVGIHALQIVPLAGIMIAVFLPSLGSGRQKALLHIFALCYLVAVALLTWQALSAESLFAFSMRARVIGSSLLGLALCAAACTIWLPPRTLLKFGIDGNATVDIVESAN
jgi:hypothetical protein